MSQYLNMEPERIILADVNAFKLYSFLDNKRPVVEIRKTDTIYLYQKPNADCKHLIVVCKYYDKTKLATFLTSKLFGIPFVLYYSEPLTGERLYSTIWAHVKKYQLNNAEQHPVEYPFDLNPRFLTACGICGQHTCQGCKIANTPNTILLRNSCNITVIWKPTIIVDKDNSEIALHDTCLKEESKTSPNTLHHCLQLFCATEQLSPKDAWYCPNCKEFKEAYKKFDLWKLPKYLVIHLKRFQYNKQSRDKITSMIHFPKEKLDISPYVISSAGQKYIYDLYAVSNHSGGLSGGHYTANAKNCATGLWYNFNDATAVKISDDSVVNQNAYLLFYERTEILD